MTIWRGLWSVGVSYRDKADVPPDNVAARVLNEAGHRYVESEVGGSHLVLLTTENEQRLKRQGYLQQEHWIGDQQFDIEIELP